MRKILYLALATTLFSTAAFAADGSLSDTRVEDELDTNFFNYKSDRCNDIKDPEELFSIAMELRDSPSATEKVAAVDCFIGAAMRGHGQAEYELARMYSVGTVVAQSDIFAYRWAQMAVMDKYEPARALRDSLEKRLSVADFDEALNGARRIYEERERYRTQH